MFKLLKLIPKHFVKISRWVHVSNMYFGTILETNTCRLSPLFTKHKNNTLYHKIQQNTNLHFRNFILQILGRFTNRLIISVLIPVDRMVDNGCRRAVSIPFRGSRAFMSPKKPDLGHVKVTSSLLINILFKFDCC